MIGYDIEESVHVEKSLFDNDSTLPYVYFSDSCSCDLVSYYKENERVINADLVKYGAILFRNFDVATLESFDKFANVAIKKLVPYVGGATPRKALSKSVSTSTEFPEDQEIKFHNELSYEIHPPKKLIFCCLVAPKTGGQTQIADVRQVLQYIDKDILDEFRKRGGWKLIRNFGMGFGPTIQAAFDTEDVSAIERDCHARNTEFKFIKDGHIRTIQIREAIHRHPESTEEIWFNHVAFWHPSSLSKMHFEYMSRAFSLEEFPYMVFFGDGSIIPDSYVDNIRQAYTKAERLFDWQEKDVLLIDNYSVAHGRKAFTGDRKIVVSMGM